ncbi:hypothetical protein FT641_19290 [Bacillus paranthracis]|uniref:hypothetical protein n=2 Tax=Bacillus paranthracis TaxID=2026186 RepID=UPI0018793724|nr:hypothetical protein [Bacillus paranthracis]MBE7114290.1 hypothetical protein [Bacillus paranthracis]MBE7154837.1 hypothetical protein [Bacillus paranthracis]
MNSNELDYNLDDFGTTHGLLTPEDLSWIDASANHRFESLSDKRISMAVVKELNDRMLASAKELHKRKMESESEGLGILPELKEILKEDRPVEDKIRVTAVYGKKGTLFEVMTKFFDSFKEERWGGGVLEVYGANVLGAFSRYIKTGDGSKLRVEFTYTYDGWMCVAYEKGQR